MEVDRETQLKLNFSHGYELTLWLVRLMSFHPKYNAESSRLFERDAVETLIKDYLQIVSGKFCWQSLIQYLCFKRTDSCVPNEIGNAWNSTKFLCPVNAS